MPGVPIGCNGGRESAFFKWLVNRAATLNRFVLLLKKPTLAKSFRMIWKILTFAFAIACVVLLFVLEKNSSASKLSDPRLHGTWVSDRERTLESLGTSTLDEGRAKLENLFGKLKITYTDTTITTELDDFVETIPYTVLGVDDHSVVIRDDSPPDPDMAVLEMSSFSKIHFDGEDSYWITTEIGGITEYFKRVSHAVP